MTGSFRPRSACRDSRKHTLACDSFAASKVRMLVSTPVPVVNRRSATQTNSATAQAFHCCPGKCMAHKGRLTRCFFDVAKVPFQFGGQTTYVVAQKVQLRTR